MNPTRTTNSKQEKRVSARGPISGGHSRRGIYKKEKAYKEIEVVYLKDLIEEEIMKQPADVQHQYREEKSRRRVIQFLDSQLQDSFRVLRSAYQQPDPQRIIRQETDRQARLSHILRTELEKFRGVRRKISGFLNSVVDSFLF